MIMGALELLKRARSLWFYMKKYCIAITVALVLLSHLGFGPFGETLVKMDAAGTEFYSVVVEKVESARQGTRQNGK